MKNVEVNKFKDVINTYFIKHTQKFNLFTVCISLIFEYGVIDPSHRKICVSNIVFYSINSENYSTYTTLPADDFIHLVIGRFLSHECSPRIIPEIEIQFISDLKDITKRHNLELPKSMLCRKLIRRFHEAKEDFECKWLPDSFRDL